jgi:hypothetical protein
MAITGVAKITSFPAGMDAGDLAFDELIEQMIGDDVYIAEGTLTPADVASLSSIAAYDTALSTNFDVLGELAEKPGKIDSKLDSLKTRNYKVAGKRTNTLELKLVGISQLQKKYLESPAFSATTMTIILRSREKDRVIILNGMKWTADWSSETDALFDVLLSTEFAGTTDTRIYVFKDISAT